MAAAAVTNEEAVADIENPKPSAAEVAETAEEPEAVGVGVLGWLGFVIANLAAWGFITFSTYISWYFGLGVCVVYTGLLIGLALWLERRGPSNKQFVNLLWVLAGWFLFISGGYIAVRVLGEGGLTNNVSGGVNYPQYPDGFDRGDLLSLLPSGSSAEAQQWASNSMYVQNPTYTTFAGQLYFTGRGASSSSQSLQHSDGVTVQQVSPEIRSANDFQVVGSALYVQSGSRLYRISPANVSSAEEIPILGDRVTCTGTGCPGGFSLSNFFAESTSEQLLIRASLYCSVPCANYDWQNSNVHTIIAVNTSNPSSTVDLRGDSCSVWRAGVVCPIGGGSSVLPGPTRGSLWGVIFLAAVPMLILSFFVLIKKQMPGMVFNIFGGVFCIVVVSYLIIFFEDPAAGFLEFLRWFTMIYTSILWKALINWSLIKEDLPAWLEEVKTWSAAVVGVSFFITIHFVLYVPFTTEAWRWVVYALLALLQMLMSAVVQRTVPMVTGALAAFVVAWKIGSEVSSWLSFGSYEVQTLTMFAIIGAEGVGIILAAIAFANNREKLQDAVRGALCCRQCRKAAD